MKIQPDPRFSLWWDLGKVAAPGAVGRDPRWLVVSVGSPSDVTKALRGKRMKVGHWLRMGGGTTVPGLQLLGTPP